MTYDPEKDPIVIAAKASAKKAEADAQANSDRMLKDDNLARAKGKTPEQVEARKRVAALFCHCHMPGETPEALKPVLDNIDYTLTVTNTNGRQVNLEKPKGTGLLGMGKKPHYLQSKAFPPTKPEDPIYVLEYFQLQEHS